MWHEMTVFLSGLTDEMFAHVYGSICGSFANFGKSVFQSDLSGYPQNEAFVEISFL